MTAIKFQPCTCACGAPGYVKPVADASGDVSDDDWRFQLVPDAKPVSPPPREYRIAVHEAAHAVVAHVLKRTIDTVTINGQPHVSYIASSAHRAALAMIAMAADHAERLLLQKHEYRPETADVISTFNSIRQFEFGGCDRCLVAFAIIQMHGPGASDETLLATYRALEAQAIEILRTPIIASAIRKLAEVLMQQGEIDGLSAHQIITAAGVDHGSTAALTQRNKADA